MENTIPTSLSGVVAERFVDQGDSITTGDPLVRIGQT